MRAARGFTVCFLQLLVATSAATSSSANTDGIHEVGIAAVHPICDPLQEGECISSDEQVQDDIIAGLEADDEVSAAPNMIELGELLCEGLGEASSSTLLRFAISSNETVVAERTSYSESDGAAFSDNKERKTWKGEVIDPAPAADAAPSTISMTWTSQCETETFVLKMTTRNTDDTISITTSMPCAAGSVNDICLAQYDLDLPPLADDLEAATHGGRRLKERRSTGDGRISKSSASRQLQSTVEIEVMVLYDQAVLDTYSTEQLETIIADELPFANEAAENSQVDLRFSLVHTGLLPYAVQSTNSPNEAFNLRTNADVQALRDEYQADLVVLVGVFDDFCGWAYINADAVPADENFGYSVLHRFCFDGRTLTHELGHNMGADHDRANTALAETDYGHGLRWCAADSPARYRTIMTYPCSRNTGPDESSNFAEQINYFSNPDVSYLGLPTGAPTEDAARVVRENMVVVSNFRGDGGDPPSPTPAPVTDGDAMCAAGILGILAGDVCCPSSCGACGGVGCGGRDGGDNFTGSEACCSGGVNALGRVCSATVGAPCIVSDDSPLPPTPAPVTDELCAAGIPGILASDVCCPSSCGACGGVGCSGRDGGDDFNGSQACCGGGVRALGRICSATVGAPCVVADEEMCAAGIPGILASDVCCPNSCGACGGTGCSGRDGGDDFTGGEACCQGGVKDLGRVCSATVGAPCVVTGDPPPPPTPAPVTDELCAAGIPGILASDVCCPNSCGACGGVGCSGRDGGDDFTGSQACCGGGVRALNRVCSATVGAPCVVSETETEMCATGVPGILASDVCCPSSCGSCGGVGCSGRDGSSDFTGSQACCEGGVRALNRVCSPGVGAPCVVSDGDDDDEDDDTPSGEFTCDGVEKGDYCCSDGCGECGGSGCSSRGGGLTGDDCCQSDILASGRLCSVTGAAPCFVD